MALASASKHMLTPNAKRGDWCDFTGGAPVLQALFRGPAPKGSGGEIVSSGRDKVNVAIVGLGFGVQFIPIYKRHPQANMYAICRRSKAALNAVGDAFGVDRRYERYNDLLSDKDVGLVHINWRERRRAHGPSPPPRQLGNFSLGSPDNG